VMVKERPIGGADDGKDGEGEGVLEGIKKFVGRDRSASGTLGAMREPPPPPPAAIGEEKDIKTSSPPSDARALKREPEIGPPADKATTSTSPSAPSESQPTKPAPTSSLSPKPVDSQPEPEPEPAPPPSTSSNQSSSEIDGTADRLTVPRPPLHRGGGRSPKRQDTASDYGLDSDEEDAVSMPGSFWLRKEADD